MAKKPKGVTRRDFLKRTGAAAAAAATTPSLSLPQSSVPVRGVLSQSDILPPAFDAGFSLPATGENIVMLDADAVLWGGDWYGNMTKEQMLANKAILEQARRTMPPTTDRPMAFNHLTKQWHEEALRDPVGLGEFPDSYQKVFLKAGKRAPDAHNLLQTEHYLPEDFSVNAYESGTLTRGAEAYGGPNIVDEYENNWWRERRGVLQHNLRDNDNAKEMARSDEGRMLLREMGIAPGGRFEQQRPIGDQDNPITGLVEPPVGGEPGPRNKRDARLIRALSAALATGAGASLSESEAEAAPKPSRVPGPSPQMNLYRPPQAVTDQITDVRQLGDEGTPNSIRLIEQIAPFYEEAGGVEDAIRRAQESLSAQANPRFRKFFPAFDIEGYRADQTAIPMNRLSKKMAGEFLPDGYSAQVVRNGRVVDHVADGDQLLISRHLPPGQEVIEAVGHEGTHGAILRSLLDDAALQDSINKRGYFYQQPVSQQAVGGNPVIAKTPIKDQVVVATPRPDGDFDPVVVDTGDFQYTTSPIELDPRLAQIRRLSAQIRGQDIQTPEDAAALIDRVYRDKDFALAAGISDAESDYIGILSPQWKKWMSRRMLEVPAVGAAAGLAASEAQAGQPNPVAEYTRGQQPTNKLVGDVPTMAGITADESQRFFGRKTEDDVRYQAALKDVLTRRMVPWVKSMPEHPGVENVAAAVEAIQGRPSTGAGKALAEQFLDHMQSLSYGGANAPDATIPQSQYESWQREGGGDFRMLWGEGAIGRVTPGGAEMFENQRDYDLVRAYSQGRHSPGYEGFFPTMAAGIGEMFDPSGDTTKLYNARLKPDRSGIAEEALYWWDQSNPARDAMEGNPARYKGGIQGSRYPGLSPLTSEGFNQTVSNSDNPVGSWFTAGELAARGPFATMFTRPGELVRSLKQANDQFTVNQWAGRPAPILPDADPIAGYAGGIAAEQARQFQQKAASARAPKVLRALGAQPSYLSPAAEMGANFAGDFIADMGTMAGIGGKAVKLAKAAERASDVATALPRSVAHYATSGMADEIPSEAAIGAALYQTQQPDGPMPSMIAAEQYNPNVTLDGNPVAADSPQYDKAWRAGQREQNSRLDRVSRAAKLYRR